MQRGLMTEYEWRKQVHGYRRKCPAWCGAQCVYPSGGRKRTKLRRIWMLWVLSAVSAALLPMVVPKHQNEFFPDYTAETAVETTVRKVSAVSYLLPTEIEYQQRVFTREQMLLLSPEYPLPDDLLPPNTVSIARYGNGMVPVRELTVCAGYETIDALSLLFAQLRNNRIEGLYVWEGTTSSARQYDAMIKQVRMLMTKNPPEDAVDQVLDSMEYPGTGSLLQGYAVEIRLMDQASKLPVEEALEASLQGQALLQLCWRYGFVRESRAFPYRFRYVGKAHSTAMTYLDLDFESYLDWLHRMGAIVISAGGRPQYLILCKAMNGDYVAFDLPANADIEISMDNTGYALAACTLQ